MDCLLATMPKFVLWIASSMRSMTVRDLLLYPSKLKFVASTLPFFGELPLETSLVLSKESIQRIALKASPTSTVYRVLLVYRCAFRVCTRRRNRSLDITPVIDPVFRTPTVFLIIQNVSSRIGLVCKISF